eukprot:Selendium_serpulae@DN931_c0_g1_i1.p2
MASQSTAVSRPRKPTTIIKPVILGTYSFRFTQNEVAKRRSRGDRSTHRWTCILRSAAPGEHQGYFIRKVAFILHSSFPNPNRVCERPPFEISESGWGEFEVVVKVYLVDSGGDEEPLELRHFV